MSSNNENAKTGTSGLSSTEWEALPITLDAPAVARVTLSNLRWVQNHAEELGGRKVAGRWVFSKARLAELLGL